MSKVVQKRKKGVPMNIEGAVQKMRGIVPMDTNEVIQIMREIDLVDEVILLKTEKVLEKESGVTRERKEIVTV
jgi:hypothetical protein